MDLAQLRASQHQSSTLFVTDAFYTRLVASHVIYVARRLRDISNHSQSRIRLVNRDLLTKHHIFSKHFGFGHQMKSDIYHVVTIYKDRDRITI